MTIARVVLVTGAARGIGRAAAIRLAGPETALLLSTRKDDNGLERTARDAELKGAEVETSLADLEDPEAAARLVATAVDTFGRLDQLVSNAGFASFEPFGVLTRADLDRAHAAMAGAFFELASAALPHLQHSDWGRVVAVSSFVAHVFDRTPTFTASAAAKGALEGLVRSLAAQLAAFDVTVNAVAPGYVAKDDPATYSTAAQTLWERAAARTPLGRMAQPEDIAACIAFLLTAEARHITGQVIHVDGGLSLGTS